MNSWRPSISISPYDQPGGSLRGEDGEASGERGESGPWDKGWQEELAARVQTMGFAAAGLVRPTPPDSVWQSYQSFLGQGFHGAMGWLAKNQMARRDPRHIFAAVKTILVLAHPYDSGHPDDFSMVPPAMGAGNNHRNAHVVRPLSAFTAVPSGRVARYARGVDYHLLLKKKLAALQVWLRAQGVESRVITDSAPLFEKPMAQLAGLGWRGKHTNLVSRHLGNWFLLAEVMLSVDLLPSHSAPPADSARPAAPAAISPPAAPTSLTTIMPITRAADIDHCGSCQACLQSCPTNAFPAPYVLDARRCISYLTIEHHGIIDRAYRRAMGDMIFGCDICLAVCPFNKFAASARGMKIDEQLQGSGRIDLITILTMTTDHFAARFRQSPIKRLGLKRLQRNALIALGNYFYDHVKNMAPDDSKEKWHKQEKQRLVQLVMGHVADQDPAVRASAIWALRAASHADADDKMRVKNDAAAMANGAAGDDDVGALFARARARFLPAETDPAVRAEWF